ncbi:MAG: transketolase [Clostridiaceae bacterium]
MRPLTKGELSALKIASANIRLETLKLFKWRRYGHLGGSLSIVELLSVLYNKILNHDPNNTSWNKRDYLILSKGHAGPSLYACLALQGYFGLDMLYTLNEGGTMLPSHPDRNKTPGIDATTGSLGQGLSLAAGLGYSLRIGESSQRVYVIVGDGELNEGQCWEALQFISHHKLNEVIVIIDDNKKQLDGRTVDIIQPLDLKKKLEAFGFYTLKVNGSDEKEIASALWIAKDIKNSAVCIILDTIKGQGGGYFENLKDNHSIKLNEELDKEMDSVIEKLEQYIKGGVTDVET